MTLSLSHSGYIISNNITIIIIITTTTTTTIIIIIIIIKLIMIIIINSEAECYFDLSTFVVIKGALNWQPAVW